MVSKIYFSAFPRFDAYRIGIMHIMESTICLFPFFPLRILLSFSIYKATVANDPLLSSLYDFELRCRCYFSCFG